METFDPRGIIFVSDLAEAEGALASLSEDLYTRMLREGGRRNMELAKEFVDPLGWIWRHGLEARVREKWREREAMTVGDRRAAGMQPQPTRIDLDMQGLDAGGLERGGGRRDGAQGRDLAGECVRMEDTALVDVHFLVVEGPGHAGGAVGGRAEIRRALESVLAQDHHAVRNSSCAGGANVQHAQAAGISVWLAGAEGGSAWQGRGVGVKRLGGGGQGVAVALGRVVVQQLGTMSGLAGGRGSADMLFWLDGQDFLAHRGVLDDVLAAADAGCQVVASPALAYPTPRRDPHARLPRSEEATALWLNRWRQQLGARLARGLNAPPLFVAARWTVLEQAVGSEVLALFEETLTGSPTLMDWQSAALSVAVLEAAGRGVCFLRESAVVTSTLSAPRQVRQLGAEQRRALGTFFSRPPPPRALTVAADSERLCAMQRGGGAGEHGGGGWGGAGGELRGGAGWDVVAGACAEKLVRIVRPSAGEHFGDGSVPVLVQVARMLVALVLVGESCRRLLVSLSWSETVYL